MNLEIDGVRILAPTRRVSDHLVVRMHSPAIRTLEALAAHAKEHGSAVLCGAAGNKYNHSWVEAEEHPGRFGDGNFVTGSHVETRDEIVVEVLTDGRGRHGFAISFRLEVTAEVAEHLLVVMTYHNAISLWVSGTALEVSA